MGVTTIWTGKKITDADMRRMWREGESLGEIAAVAYRHRRLGKDEVRKIVFGGGLDELLP